MTAQAERIKAHNRGHRQAEPASRSRIEALNSFGLRYEQIDDFNVIVEGQFILNLALSYWRSIDDGETCHGYLVSGLAAEIAKRNSEKPVTGRDSVVVESGRTAPSDHPAATIAESVAGPQSDAGSASLLPVVSP